MRRGQFVLTLAIHACPRGLVAQIDALLASLSGTSSWLEQNLIPDNLSASFSFKLTEDEAAELASNLYALGPIYFEMNQRIGRTGVLFMGVPGLGVFRGELNDSGSIMLSEDRINQMVDNAAGNHREFMRLLRVSLGQSWDDIMEPFRGAKFSNNVVLLTKAG
jgi:hypothetical protein